MLLLSELEIRKRFDAKYFNNKASPEGQDSKVNMCLLDKNRNPLLYIIIKEQEKILDNNFMLILNKTATNFYYRS